MPQRHGPARETELEIGRLRNLAKVAEEGSIGAAARQLGVAQPALSRQVRALEGSVGALLITRGAAGVSLTPAGTALLREVADMDLRLAGALQRTRLAADGRLGRVRVGIGRVSLDDPRVGRALALAHALEPGIDFEVIELGSAIHTMALHRGETDFTIGPEETPHNRRTARRTLYVERVDCAILPATHPLAQAVSITPCELNDLSLLMPGTVTGWVISSVRTALRDLDMPPPAEYAALETVYALIAAGRGWMPGARSYQAHPPEGTVLVPLLGFAVDLPIVLRWRRGDGAALTLRAGRALARAFRRVVAPGVPSASRPDRGTESDGDTPPVVAELPRAGRIEARHLRALVAVANDGSFADAARRLGLTQSAVSRQLAAFERIVGMPLIARGRAGACTTPAGDVMRAEADAILALLARAVSAARLAARGIARRCDIGIVPLPLATERVRDLFRRAPELLPDLAIELHEQLSVRLDASLRSGDLDAAVVLVLGPGEDREGLIRRELAPDPVDCVLVSAQSPLAALAELEPRDLAGSPFLSFTRPRTLAHELVLGALRRVGIEPCVETSYGGPRAIWRFVADGAGWSLGTNSMRDRPPVGTVARPVKGLLLEASLCLVSRADERDPNVRALLAAI